MAFKASSPSSEMPLELLRLRLVRLPRNEASSARNLIPAFVRSLQLFRSREVRDGSTWAR